MAANFDYERAKTTMANIEQLKTRLNSTLNELDSLVKRNVNNDNVWNSDTSNAFMNEWTKYSENNFPTYIATFETQIRNINAALDAYAGTEL